MVMIIVVECHGYGSIATTIFIVAFMILVAGNNFALVFVFVLAVMVMFTVILSGHCSYVLCRNDCIRSCNSGSVNQIIDIVSGCGHYHLYLCVRLTIYP